MKDPFDFRKDTPTPTSPISAVGIDTATPTAATATEIPLPTSTATISPTEILATAIISTPLETPASALTATITATVAPSLTSGPLILLDDKFDLQPLALWIAWGEPVAQVNPAGEMELTGATPNGAGVTTKDSLSIQPGMTIQFQARVADPAPEHVLAFDWDNGGRIRRPGMRPGAIHVEIGNGLVHLLSQEVSCRRTLADTETHTFEIRIGLSGGVSLYMDDSEVCSILSAAPLLAGHISFGGNGWVDNVIVLQP